MFIKIGLSVVAWSDILLASTYWSHMPVVFSRYSWGLCRAAGPSRQCRPDALVGRIRIVSAPLSGSSWCRHQWCLSIRVAWRALELGIRVVDPLGIS